MDAELQVHSKSQFQRQSVLKNSRTDGRFSWVLMCVEEEWSLFFLKYFLVIRTSGLDGAFSYSQGHIVGRLL